MKHKIIDDEILQDTIFCSKHPRARESYSPNIIENLGMRSRKGSPALP
jgi:hypothetical protein